MLDCISGTGTRRTYINERAGPGPVGRQRSAGRGFPEAAVTLAGRHIRQRSSLC